MRDYPFVFYEAYTCLVFTSLRNPPITLSKAVLSSLGKLSTSLKYRITSASLSTAFALSSVLPLIKKSTEISNASAIF
jgi:uncharacterized protein (DUF488 family)